MSHGSTKARYQTEAQQVEEPLRSIAVHEQQQQAPRSLSAWVVLKPLVASWPLLVMGLVLGPAIVAVAHSMSPVTYSAEALIAPNRTRTQVQFEPQIKTIDNSTTQAGTSALTPERRQALVDLVRSSTVEARVVSDLSGQLPDSQLQRGAIVQQISGSIRPRSEILSIQAVAAAPSDAIAIANAWAKDYVDEVNRLYSNTSDAASIQALRDQAQQNLADAQAALSESFKSSQLETLDQQIQTTNNLLTLLQSPYQQSSSSAAPPDSKQGGASTTQTASPIMNDYRLADRRTLDDLAQTLRRIDATRQNVRAVLTQAQTTGASGASDTAVLALLKTQLVAISDALPSGLQLQLPTGVSGGTADDLHALANSLDAARSDVATEFDARRTAYEQKSAQQIGDLENQLQSLRAQREVADADRKRLTAARDLASDTYTALAKKVEEQRVSDNTAGHEVELASEATFAAALPRQSTSGLATAAAIGLVIAAALAMLHWYVFTSNKFVLPIPSWARRNASPQQGSLHDL